MRKYIMRNARLDEAQAGIKIAGRNINNLTCADDAILMAESEEELQSFLEYKESWVPKNWCFWTVMLEKTLESSLDCEEIQPVHPKGNQFWVFIGRTDAEA